MNIQQSRAVDSLPSQFFASLVKKAQQKALEHDDVIQLGQGNHDQPTPSFITEALKNTSDQLAFHRYGPFRGYSFLKEAVSDYYKRYYNVEIDPETEVAIVPGTKTAIVELCQCLLNKGDYALLPDPGYPDYLSGLAIAEAEICTMPLKEENKYLPDYTQINEQTWQQAKLMFLNYPNNPTGATATHTFFNETVNLAQKYQVPVVHDFAYGSIQFDNKKPISFLQSSHAKEVGVELFSMSKLYNMAGWRVGFVVGNAQIVAMLEELQDHYHCSIFGGIQKAAEVALKSDQSTVNELVKLYETRRNTLVAAAKEIGWTTLCPSGSFFAWFPVPEGHTSKSFSELLLEKAHIVCAPGDGFGEYGEGYIRIGLLEEADVLSEAMQRIGKLGLFKR